MGCWCRGGGSQRLARWYPLVVMVVVPRCLHLSVRVAASSWLQNLPLYHPLSRCLQTPCLLGELAVAAAAVEVRMQLLKKLHRHKKRIQLLLLLLPLRCPVRPRRCAHPWNGRLRRMPCMRHCSIAWCSCICCRDSTWCCIAEVNCRIGSLLVNPLSRDS
jgi:hypothetical protein